MDTAYEVVVAEANTPQWLRGRKTLLGASEVACVLGLSKYKSRLAIYIDKLSDSIDDSMSEWQEWGHRLEPVLAQWVADTQHMQVLPSPGLIRSLEHPWLGATPDRVNEHGEPVELKSSDRFMARDWEDGVPAAYEIQVFVQMIVLGARRGHLAVLHGGNHPEFYTIEWDQTVVDQILELGAQFWYGNVEALIAPEPVSASEAALRWPNPLDTAIEGGEALYEAHGAYGLLLAERHEIDEQLEAMKLELQTAMGDDATALTYTELAAAPLVLFTWKKRKGGTRIDTARLKEEQPDLYTDYLTTAADTRTFTYKPIKESK